MLRAKDVLPPEEIVCDEIVKGREDREDEPGEECFETEPLPLSLDPREVGLSLVFFFFNLNFCIIALSFACCLFCV